MRLWITICIFFLAFSSEIPQYHGHSENTKLLLISFDGFRWDYLDMVREKGRRTPNFDALIESGVKAKYGTKNVFVTKTFPNHYSLVTGMYEENHGVVGNIMYDPRYPDELFDKADPSVAFEPKWWSNDTTGDNGPEPIWITNQKADEHIFQRRSGVMFWPGSEVEIRGMRPHHWFKYDPTFPNKTRIDNIVKWFSSEIDPINLGCLYFSEPDHTGHNIGPNSERMVDMIVALDELVGYLIAQLKAHDLYHHMNIIITSDHGMAEIGEGHFIDISSYLDLNLIEVHAGNSPGIHLIPKKGKEDFVYNTLKNISHLNVYRKSEIPAEYHYTYNQRILDILVVAEIGYDVYMNASVEAWGQKGNHGYNNSASIMHPFFIAHGPAFKKNFVSTEMFNSIDVYPLMCEILDIEPGPHDGSLANIQHILAEDDDSLLNITMITSVKDDSQEANSSHTLKEPYTILLVLVMCLVMELELK